MIKLHIFFFKFALMRTRYLSESSLKSLSDCFILTKNTKNRSIKSTKEMDSVRFYNHTLQFLSHMEEDSRLINRVFIAFLFRKRATKSRAARHSSEEEEGEEEDEEQETAIAQLAVGSSNSSSAEARLDLDPLGQRRLEPGSKVFAR